MRKGVSKFSQVFGTARTINSIPVLTAVGSHTAINNGVLTSVDTSIFRPRWKRIHLPFHRDYIPIKAQLGRTIKVAYFLIVEKQISLDGVSSGDSRFFALKVVAMYEKMATTFSCRTKVYGVP